MSDSHNTQHSTTQWYYDLETGEVVEGKQSGWENRMGPYESKSEAQHALDKVRARNAAADAQDDEWND